MPTTLGVQINTTEHQDEPTALDTAVPAQNATDGLSLRNEDGTGWAYVRATVLITADATADFAEVQFCLRDASSGVWFVDTSINGNGKFRAVKDTDGDSVSEVLHVPGCDRVKLLYTDRTDAAVRHKSWLTFANDSQF